jgi:serine/threonine-protein kinase HipA
MRRTIILCNGKPAGTLESGKEFIFRYDKSWIDSGFALCPTMPLQGSSFPAARLHGVFLDATPDGWGRRVLQKAENYLAAQENRPAVLLQDLDCFERCDNFSRQGAIEVQKDIDAEIVPPGLEEALVSQVYYKIERIEQDEETPEDVFQGLKRGISSGGAKPKFPMLVGGKLYMAKMRSREDVVNVPAWEMVNFELAEHCGIATPEFHFHQGIKTNLFIIRRFDRKDDSRIPYISVRTMLGVHENDHTASYGDIAEKCVDEDKKELFSRMAFNAAISNLDDHVRNHGFLLREHGGTLEWRLSPVFDLESISLPQEARFHSLILGNNNTYPNRANILADHGRFGLSLKEAEEILDSLVAEIHDHWRPLAEQYVSNEGEVQLMAGCYASPLLTKTVVAVAAQVGDKESPEALVQHVVRNGLDPRELEKAMPYVDADKLREELRSAADYPERWGVKQEEFEAWGKMHELGRKREVPTPAGPRVEIVYDNF